MARSKTMTRTKTTIQVGVNTYASIKNFQSKVERGFIDKGFTFVHSISKDDIVKALITIVEEHPDQMVEVCEKMFEAAGYNKNELEGEVASNV